MKKMTKKAMLSLIAELRALAPLKPLTYGESLAVARAQAARLREIVGATEPEINLVWLREQEAVPVHFSPSHSLHEHSGLSTDLVDDKLQMFINDSEPQTRQRFSLLHEFKHVLDFKDQATLHAKLGTGDKELKGKMIEWICNEFAGQVLMPLDHVKRIWSKTGNDLELSAAFFNVSREAMQTRLQRLGFIGSKKQRSSIYFRGAGPLGGLDASLSPCAA